MKAYEKDETSGEYIAIERELKKLEKRVRDWTNWQVVLFGSTLLALESELPECQWPPSTFLEPEEATILVPSAYPDDVIRHPDFERFAMTERRLREAHANDLLRGVRRRLHYQAFYRKKNEGSYGQAAQTRYQRLKAAEKEKMDKLRREYEYTRMKVLRLSTPDQPCHLHALGEVDCRPPVIEEEGPGRSWESVSWIWRDKSYHGPDLGEWAVEGKPASVSQR